MTEHTVRLVYGPDAIDRVCPTCHATWSGHPDDDPNWCWWCWRAEQRQRDLERDLILHPPWLRGDTGAPRYDELDEATQRVWDRTRGQARGADSLVAWATRLRRAVDTELITPAEADRALRRIAR